MNGELPEFPELPAPPERPSPYAPPAADPASARTPLHGLLVFVLTGLGGAVVGVVATSAILWMPVLLQWPWLERSLAATPGVSVLWAVTFCLLMLWPQVLLHEGGHALAGLARGMQPLAFGVGPWRWERGGDRWRLRRGGHVRGVSGFAILLPRGERGQSRFDQFAYLIGGPAANLTTLAAVLVLLPLTTDAPVAASFLAGTGAGAATLGLINLLPFETHGWRSDGRNILDLFRRSPDAERARRARRWAWSAPACRATGRPRSCRAAGRAHGAAGPGRHPGRISFAHALDRGDAVLARARAPARGRPCGGAGSDASARRHRHGELRCIERDRELLAAWRELSKAACSISPRSAPGSMPTGHASGDGPACDRAGLRARIAYRVPDEVAHSSSTNCWSAWRPGCRGAASTDCKGRLTRARTGG